MRPHPSASKVTSTTVSPWATKPVLAGEQLVVELHVRARETRRPSGGRRTAGRSSSAMCRDGLKGPGRVGAGGGEPDDWTPGIAADHSACFHSELV